MNESEFARYYKEETFWEKIRGYASAIGKEGIRNALILYYNLQDPEGKVPTWAKGVVLGALGYFIFPLDAIPDMVPVRGFTDDLGVLAAAVGAIALNIPSEAKERARAKMEEWFDEGE